VHKSQPLQPADHFNASIVTYDVDGLVVSRVRFDPVRLRRSAATLSDDDRDCISIQHYLSGSIRGRVGGHELYIAPDRISIQDFSVPYHALAQASEVLGVAIPRNRVASSDRLGDRRPVLSLPLNTARGALLSGAVRGVWDELSAGRVYEPATVAGALVGLVDGLIDHSLEICDDGEPLHLMEQYLRERLGNVTLGAEDLQRAFHYSRSAIYRLFEPHGGVAAFIRTERLARCHAELIRSTDTPRSVSRIAARFGFRDASHFSRVFRGQYGVAPSELITAAARDADAHPGIGARRSADAETIRSWLGAA
jgi:AraC-like DNA-binding protein